MENKELNKIKNELKKIKVVVYVCAGVLLASGIYDFCKGFYEGFTSGS